MKDDVELYFIPTDDQLADVFTKPLDESRFMFLISKLGMLNENFSKLSVTQAESYT